MAVYRQFKISYWQDEFVGELPTEEKFFYAYLLTNSKTTQCGIYKFNKTLAMCETGYDRETIDRLLEKFVSYKKILVSEETYEIMVLNWVKHNFINSKNTITCMNTELKEVKNPAFLKEFYSRCEAFGYPVQCLFRGIDLTFLGTDKPEQEECNKSEVCDIYDEDCSMQEDSENVEKVSCQILRRVLAKAKSEISKEVKKIFKDAEEDPSEPKASSKECSVVSKNLEEDPKELGALSENFEASSKIFSERNGVSSKISSEESLSPSKKTETFLREGNSHFMRFEGASKGLGEEKEEIQKKEEAAEEQKEVTVEIIKARRTADGAAAFKKVVEAFSSNIHLASPFEYKKLQHWMEDISPELILMAIQEAVDHNARSMSYVNSVLNSWHDRGFTTAYEVQQYTAKRARDKAKNNSAARPTHRINAAAYVLYGGDQDE